MELNFDGKRNYKEDHSQYYIYTKTQKENGMKKKKPEKTFATSGQVKSVGWGTFIVIVLVLLLTLKV